MEFNLVNLKDDFCKKMFPRSVRAIVYNWLCFTEYYTWLHLFNTLQIPKKLFKQVAWHKVPIYGKKYRLQRPTANVWYFQKSKYYVGITILHTVSRRTTRLKNGKLNWRTDTILKNALF